MSAPAPPQRRPLRQLLVGGGFELLLLAALYAGYSASRLFADGSLSPALARGEVLLDMERLVGLDIERWLNNQFVDVALLGLAGSFYYATAHYLVTAGVLAWLWLRGPASYVPARRALVAATLAALALYLLLPTAPPRLMDGYADVLHLSAAQGWWGADASAPRGLGGYTNELAAFPSMHAGWALWAAWVVQREVRRPWVRAVACAHALITAVVIVGTGNHWLLDVVAGWIVMGIALATAGPALVTEAHSPVRRERGSGLSAPSATSR